jgi:hypothetical protein
MSSDPLEEALAIEKELAALDRVEVPPYVIRWKGDGSIVISKDDEVVAIFDELECADDLSNENFHDFSPEDAALLRDAVVDAYHRSIALHSPLHQAIARLREQGDQRDRARQLVAKDDARLAALDEQRHRERVATARRHRRRPTAITALVVVGAIVSLVALAELLRHCQQR